MPPATLDAFALLCIAAFVGLIVDSAWTLLTWRRPFGVKRTSFRKRLASLAQRLDRRRRSDATRFARGAILAAMAMACGALLGLALAWLSEALPYGWVLVPAVVVWSVDLRAVLAPAATVLRLTRARDAAAAAALLRALGHPAPSDQHGVIRTAIGLCGLRFGRNLTVPVFALCAGGLPLLLAWRLLDGLLRALETDEAAQGAVRRGFARVHAVVAWLPMRVAALSVAVGAAIVPRGKPFPAFAASIGRDPEEGPLDALAAALDATLGRPGAWIGEGRARLAPDDLRRAIFLLATAAVVHAAAVAGLALAVV